MNVNIIVMSQVSRILANLFLLLCIVGLLSFYITKRFSLPGPKGVWILSTFLITGTLYKLWGFRDFGYYKFMFQQLPLEIIQLRYMASVMLRIVGLIIGIGLLFYKDIFRKLAVFLGWFTLGILYWKHPTLVFENLARQSERYFLNTPATSELANPLYPKIALIFHMSIDIIFALSLIIYLTRPGIKEYFEKGMKMEEVSRLSRQQVKKQQLLISVFLSNAILAGASLFFLPSMVAVHFGLNGSANSWQPKFVIPLFFFIFELPLFLFFLNAPTLLLKCSPKLLDLPDKDYWLKEENKPETQKKLTVFMSDLGVALFVFLFFIGLLTFEANLTESVMLNERLLLSVLLAFLTFLVYWCVKFMKAFQLPRKREGIVQ